MRDDAVQIWVLPTVNLKPDSYREQNMDLYGKVSVTMSRLIYSRSSHSVIPASLWNYFMRFYLIINPGLSDVVKRQQRI